MQMSSKALQATRHLWGALKPAPIKALLEVPDIADEAVREIKRPRRH